MYRVADSDSRLILSDVCCLGIHVVQRAFVVGEESCPRILLSSQETKTIQALAMIL